MTLPTRATFIERSRRDENVENNAATDADDRASASVASASGDGRKFFGEKLSSWGVLDGAGEISATFGASFEEGVTAEVFYTCDVARARARARLTVGGDRRDAACETRAAASGGETGELEVWCAFDGVDTSMCESHDVVNVGAFEIVLRGLDGAEMGRCALLTRVERDQGGEARRMVLPFKAEFSEEKPGESDK